MQSLRAKFKNNTLLTICVRLWRSWRSLGFNPFVFLREFLVFVKAYCQQKQNPSFGLSLANLYPVLNERTYYQALDPVYFFQDVWCARKVFEDQPKRHIDIASSLKLTSILAQFVPCVFVDINKPDLKLAGLEYVQADIRRLPFAADSLESVSSICVLEHIGLGRYGDEIDAFGSEKAASELKRVLARKGNLYISVPVDRENRIYFNAHRAFTRDYILKLFAGLELKEEKYIYGKVVEDGYQPTKGFGTGMYHFYKE